ncbi:TPA: hypothetical protein QDC20_000292 [Burkholderia aenigmatica]|uniref:hypothetical protein n=1 Tax=Burkholderia sp. AU45251 TaxID=3059204 RepID=UPI00265467B2|nr:hypothetical protein [Burkholderia sp. AU45251]HDR9483193.1 hypothetical protein [Burkholderia aenigmatica]MDN7516058.1 hypothetical protein [Burkholderia sp. AU45251]HDR9514141.1 hypothetical protein [Burkholderia aenigmatica]HDR9591531.1 hypothetical protein [Burkholderia aenigmatica]HDR9598623.1 hypothetical protein [Burkholderia aenigmatica]
MKRYLPVVRSRPRCRAAVRRSYRTLCAAALVAIATVSVAQVPPAPRAEDPAGAMPPPPPPRPRARLPAGAGNDTASDALVSGTLSRLTINPEGTVDGFVLTDGTLVRLPPHLGSQLAALVRSGERVTVAGERRGDDEIQARVVRNDSTGASLSDQPPAPVAPVPPVLRGVNLARLSVSGVVRRVTRAPRGEPDGVMLDSGAIVKLTVPAAQQFGALLAPGERVAAVGYGTRNAYGEALQATAFGAPGHVVNLYDDVAR